MEQLRLTDQEIVIEECSSIDEVDAYLGRIFDGRLPRIPQEVLINRGKLSREVDGLKIDIEQQGTRYIVSIQKAEHYDNI